MADVPKTNAGAGKAAVPNVHDPAGGPQRVPFNVKTAAAMAALYVILGLLAETQVADLAAALAWAIAAGVALVWGPKAVAELNGLVR